MSHRGWIKLHRKIKDHWIYQEKRKFSRYEAWLDLMMRANHKDNKVLLGNELIDIERGQLITSELKLMEAWGWGKSKTRNFLDLLESDGMIVKKSDRKKTVITICKYSDYHENDGNDRPQADHKQTASEPRADTEKNVKNAKNEKKYSPKQVYDESSLYYRLANYFLGEIRKNNPDHKTPNMQTWSDDIRKMMELDNRNEEQIRYLMHWVQADDFEMANVLSPNKLRKRFDQLVIKVKSEKRPATVKPIELEKPKSQLRHEQEMRELGLYK